MTDRSQLTDSQKLDLLLDLAERIVASPAAPAARPAEPPHVPELALADIDPATIDGKTVQRDGSTWIMTPTRTDGEMIPVCVLYGYISEHKDPALWARMVEVFARNGGEERLRELLAKNGAFARYRMHPSAVLSQPGATAFQLFSMLLASATPETKPTA